ncbi:MAG: UvrB/UvrC motif-containing protein [Desulfotomaculales bacterium]
MLCEKCKERPATVHYTEIVNNQKREMHLCEVCAREEGMGSFGFFPQLDLHNFLAGILEPEPAGIKVRPSAVRCPACNLTEREFAAQGLLGCGECYNHFGTRLEPVLRRIHGAATHVGKKPARTAPASCRRTAGQDAGAEEIARLKAELAEAVAREEFERAAELRDRIRALEQKHPEQKHK